MKKIVIELYDNEWNRLQYFPGKDDVEKVMRALAAAYDLYRRAGALIREEEIRKKNSLIWTPPGSV